MEKIYHPYHLVDPSPWPYVMGCGALLTTLGAVVYFHYSQLILLFFGVLTIISCLIMWVKDVVRDLLFKDIIQKLLWGG